jgi:hypothetical protein
MAALVEMAGEHANNDDWDNEVNALEETAIDGTGRARVSTFIDASLRVRPRDREGPTAQAATDGAPDGAPVPGDDKTPCRAGPPHPPPAARVYILSLPSTELR